MSFETNPFDLKDVLERAKMGKLQLPDFQRSWVWDVNRIRDVIASVVAGYPVGAIMTLQTGGEVRFLPRAIQGVTPQKDADELILDGQQRTTSLYRAMMHPEVVETETERGKKTKAWFYIDIRKAQADAADLAEAVIYVDESKTRKSRGSNVALDLTTEAKEYEALHFPVNRSFDALTWIVGALNHVGPEHQELITWFSKSVLDRLSSYKIPIIRLGKDTNREAVCLVFEKVNTGGKALDAFELVTAAFAAESGDVRLREEWAAQKERLFEHKVLHRMEPTDFLQVVSLLHTGEKRDEAVASGKSERELPAVSAKRATLLALPLSAYQKHKADVEAAFVKAAKFLHRLRIFKAKDLPYKTQLVPLAAIIHRLGSDYDNADVRQRLEKWYWNGVFGELYGSATDTRVANDFQQVPHWARTDEGLPATIADASFKPRRLDGMRTRVSAAYKGMNALLMAHGARDWLSGETFEQQNFFGEDVDVHHIFPRAWCKAAKIERNRYDAVPNRTPLALRTNRILGGKAPSEYLTDLEAGAPNRAAVDPDGVNARLATHLIDPSLLRADDFEAHYAARRAALLDLIRSVIGDQSVQAEERVELDAFDDSDYADEDEQDFVEAA